MWPSMPDEKTWKIISQHAATLRALRPAARPAMQLSLPLPMLAANDDLARDPQVMLGK